MVAAATALAASFGSAGVVQAQSQPAKPDTANSEGLRIEHTNPTDTMENLNSAVRELREATVLMLNQKAPGPKRAEAVEAAQDALMQTQEAILQLPPDMRIADTKIREAKDWPLVMKRLTQATNDLQDAAKTLSQKATGEEHDKAVATMRKALRTAQEAMADLPEWSAGQPMTTGQSSADGSSSHPAK
jgi:hypothetical protein